ncbi:MAG: hypothetical protein HDQ96_10145 [Lachnospiraceae bacterium]|nr:hypothetical protein [Lachnospiraceae bacterium]
MNKNTYKLINEFECCGRVMATVIMNKTTCVMPEVEYNKIIETERKFIQKNKLRRLA